MGHTSGTVWSSRAVGHGGGHLAILGQRRLSASCRGQTASVLVEELLGAKALGLAAGDLGVTFGEVLDGLGHVDLGAVCG